MKKRILLMLGMLSCLLLSACSGERYLYGEVIARRVEQGAATELVLQNAEGEQVGVIVTDETVCYSWIDGVGTDALSAQDAPGMKVFVRSKGILRRMDLETGERIRAYRADSIEISQVLTEDVLCLADGTPLDIWKSLGYSTYCLEDGTELLVEEDMTGPEMVYVSGQASFADLNEAAQRNVKAFYEEQGMLYSIRDELERAYAAYLAGGKDVYDACMVGQHVSPSASSERLMYFLTSVTQPINAGNATQYQLGAAFDRKTGEQMDAMELFSVDEETAFEAFMEISGIAEPALREELRAAFRPEYLLFFPDNLQISYPQGTLPSQAYTYILAMDYDERLRGILHEWAVPQNGK